MLEDITEVTNYMISVNEDVQPFVSTHVHLRRATIDIIPKV